MSTTSHTADHHDDIVYPAAIPFVLVHLACFGAIWTGVPPQALALAILLYVVRMFGITAGFHRYFSHKSFKTSRAFQFVLAFLAQTSAQSGVLWWASRHRDHHRHSDTPEDVHSPRQFGVFFSHIGWVYSVNRGKANYSNVKDLTKYPELFWLDRHIHLPAVLCAVGCFAFGAWPGLIVGFFWSTVALYHGTFAINSIAHLWGKKRFFTADESRNNFVLALLTLGEGWHNNHHYHMASARQGFRWWELDLTYWLLRLLAVFRVVWDIQEPTKAVVNGTRRLSQAHIRSAAQQVVQQVSTVKRPGDDLLDLVHAESAKLVRGTTSLPDVVDLALKQIQSKC